MKLLTMQSGPFRKCTNVLSFLVAVFVICGLLSSLNFYGFESYRRPQESAPVDETPVGVVKKRPLLSVETMHYVKFGHSLNKSPNNDSSEEDYLHYIRSSIARPSKSIERSSQLLSPQDAQATNGQAVDKRLKGKRHGFFVECGAADGFLMSQSLFLELRRNWTGLLVEANNGFYKHLLQLNRQAFVFGGCLSVTRQPEHLEFTSSGHFGGFESLMNHQQLTWARSFAEKAQQRYQVSCFPLMDLLKAIDVNHVDFFSLDTQGGELQILKTIDFRAVRIDILMIEVENDNGTALIQQRTEMREFFNLTGLYKEERPPDERDLMFTRIDLE